MSLSLRNIFINIVLLIFCSNIAEAQATGQFIKPSIGFGTSTSNNEEKNPNTIDGLGFFIQGEYVFGITKMFSVRPYVGFITTSANDDIEKSPKGYKVETKAFLLGGKIRLCSQFPWIAPFLETGLGASIGSFETNVAQGHIKKSGTQLHIPLGIGFALGRENNFEIAATLYMHPEVKQSSGAFTAGFSFPID